MTSSLLELVRAADAEDRERDRVLDAARAAILDFGVRRTSIGEIARRGGLSPATLHRRFGQKSEIVLALLLREVRDFLDGVDESVETTGTAEEQIADLAYVVFTSIREHALLQRLIAIEADDVLPLLTTQAEPFLALGADYLIEFIERLQREGKVESFDARPVAELLARLCLSLALTPGTTVPLDEATFRAFATRHVAGILR